MCTIDYVFWDGKGEKERSEISHLAGLVRRSGWCVAESQAVNDGGRYVPKESIRFSRVATPPFLNPTAVAAL